MLWPHRDRHLRVERTIDNLELRRNVYGGAHLNLKGPIGPIGPMWRSIIQDCMAHNLSVENPYAARDLASRPAKECGADPDDRQTGLRTDRKSRARANSQSAKCHSPSGHVYRLRPKSLSGELVRS